MKGSLKTSILNYLQALDLTAICPSLQERQQDWWTKKSKTLSAIEIVLFFSTPLLIASFSVESIAAPQKIAQVNPGNSINRPTLKVGSQGERVSELQAALKLLGFYSGAVDGIYNENMASAVSRFKQAAGLNPDGVVDANTWQRLFPNEPIVASTISSPQSALFNSAANFPVPTQPNNVTRVINPSPNPPKKAASQIVNSNPEPKPANPKQGTTPRVQKTPNRTGQTTRTQSATRTEQTTRTQSNPSTKRTPGIQYTSEGWPILRVGMRGSEVVKLQERLQKLGFLDGGIDGDFGETTEIAVKATQKRYGLEADGIVGGSTWEILLRRSPQKR